MSGLLGTPPGPFLMRSAVAALGMFLSGMISYAVLASDARNDRRYVQVGLYSRDRERDGEMNRLIQERVHERLAETDRKLDGIAADVKELLKHSGRGL